MSLQHDLVSLLRSVFHSADSCSTVGGSSFARKPEATPVLLREGPRRPKQKTATLGWMSLMSSGLFQTCRRGRPHPQVGLAASLGSGWGLGPPGGPASWVCSSSSPGIQGCLHMRAGWAQACG